MQIVEVEWPGRANGLVILALYHPENNPRIVRSQPFRDCLCLEPGVVSALTDDELCSFVRDVAAMIPTMAAKAEAEQRDREEGMVSAPKRSRSVRKSNLYLMESNGIYKIGVGYSVENRRKALATASGYPVRIVEWWPMANSEEARLAEQEWHAFFGAERMNGEWFALDDEAVRLMCKQMEVRRVDSSSGQGA